MTSVIGCPKPCRIEDSQLVSTVRAYQKCMLGGACYGGLDVHHIQSRGSGGGDTKDNLILLCRKHHNFAHAAKIPRDILHGIVDDLWATGKLK